MMATSATHGKRDPRADDQAGEDVAPLIVRSEQKAGRARRQQAGTGKIADGRRVRRQKIGKDGDKHQRQDDHEAGHGKTIFRKAPPGDIGTTEPGPDVGNAVRP